jgi:dTDP-4-dehydrorhamnose reductase
MLTVLRLEAWLQVADWKEVALKSVSLPYSSALELWGGVECTVNRVLDQYFEQLDRTGHSSRLSDLNLFAALGIKALRHAVLWERVAPRSLSNADWRWSDASLQRLRELSIRPIVGLVHHGSGPTSTNLLDCEFPEKLATYARGVAQRYPWVEDYTPVNEPLTTARFSCLYGHWYPHAHDDGSFARTLVNECRAVVLSMKAIREVNPAARLVQTDDLGKTFSTPKLAYQADLENQRRWLSFDLLCGRIDRNHPMWGYLMRWGLGAAEVEWFLENPCPPDVIGVNHYLSGERYLDDELERYPEYSHGGNGRDRYADILAARVRAEGAAGPEALAMEAWERYGIPVAVTECHNGCTREEQLRWFHEVWQAALNARHRGAKVIAVTAWSLLGAFDWNHLVTRNDGHYESGVYDIRSSSPRPTALAAFIRDLGQGQGPEHPLLRVPGWWKRRERFIYGFARRDSGELVTPHVDDSQAFNLNKNIRPVLITGGRGTLGQAFARICALRAIPHRLLSREECDIASPESVRKVLFQTQPWAIVNTAGYVRVDDAERDPERCYRENTLGPAVLAAECAERGIQFLTFSSDLVFGGKSVRPYVESDATSPLNIYGHTKAEAEQRVLSRISTALIVRSSAFFGPWDEHNFVTVALRTLAHNQEFRAAADATVSPTYVADLVNGCLDLLIDGESGIWHVANRGEISWAGLAESAAEYARIPADTLVRCELQDLKLPAPRPRYSALGSQRALLLPTLDDALRRFLAESEIPWNAAPRCGERLAA